MNRSYNVGSTTMLSISMKNQGMQIVSHSSNLIFLPPKNGQTSDTSLELPCQRAETGLPGLQSTSTTQHGNFLLKRATCSYECLSNTLIVISSHMTLIYIHKTSETRVHLTQAFKRGSYKGRRKIAADV